MIGELSESKAEQVGQTHFFLSQVKNDAANRTVLCELSYGRLNDEEKFILASGFAKMGVQLSDEDYKAAEEEEFSKKAVAEILMSHGIL